MEKQNILKGVYFSKRQIELGEEKTANLGLSFNKWVQYLVMKEIEPLSDNFTIAELELEKEIAVQKETLDDDDNQTLPF